MDDALRLEALEAENERLRDELDRVLDSLGQRWSAPIELGLTGQETRIFGRLLKGGLCSKDHLMTVCYRSDGGLREEPEMKIIDVFVCKLRGKIKRFGIEIGTRWGLGYEMSATMIEKFNREWGDGAKTE